MEKSSEIFFFLKNSRKKISERVEKKSREKSWKKKLKLFTFKWQQKSMSFKNWDILTLYDRLMLTKEIQFKSWIELSKSRLE